MTYFIETAFNRSARRRPIASLLYNDDTKEVTYIPFVGNSRAEIEDKIIAKLVSLLIGNTVVLNNFKNYLETITELKKYYPTLSDIKFNNIYDTIQPEIIVNDVSTIKEQLAKRLVKTKTITKQGWQRLAAKATIVYYELQKRGVFCEGTLVHPIYSIDTFSGRSKTAGFNIQGMTNECNITPISNNYDTFVCADWISADMRMASLMSGDGVLQDSFKTSDPYLFIADKLGGVSRDECKRSLFRGVYSLDYNSPALELYPKLKQWVVTSCEKLAKDKFLTSILGRKFYLDEERDEKSVVNASIQGSVAHAMQSVMVRLYEKMPHYIVTELHDSVILCCNFNSVKSVIGELKEIMLHPFEGLSESNPRFPVKISVGNTWRNWKAIKEYR